MENITEEILENVLDKIDGLDEETVAEMIQGYFGKQPFLMMYIMSFNDELESEDAKDDLVFILLVVMECFYSLGKEIPLISQEVIDKEEEKDLAMITKIENMTDDNERMEAMLSFMPEEETLFMFVGETLGIEDEEMNEENEEDEETGAIFGGIKLVVEVLAASLNKGGLKAV